ncbi:MAG: hypothetical protein M1837_001729 [Sclerophora amabilis]|nr:MAG: hypothetical protein M1837_001729 [Sclerophora amabilis]
MHSTTDTYYDVAKARALLSERFSEKQDSDTEHPEVIRGKFRVKAEPAEIQKLVAEFDREEQRYPRLEYDLGTGVAIITLQPSAVLSVAATAMATPFFEAIMSPDLKPYLKSAFDTCSFRKDEEGGLSRRIPDFAVWNKRTGIKGKPILVLEVGVSESYKNLKEDVEMWLGTGRGVRMVLLIDIQENPAYQNPLRDSTPEEMQSLSLLSETEIWDQMHSATGDPFGRHVLQGRQWLGQMSASAEVWIRDAATGQATMQGQRQAFVGPEVTPENVPNDLEIRVRDFYPELEGESDPVVTIAWHELRETMDQSWKDFGVERVLETLEAARKKVEGKRPLKAKP